MRGLQYRGQQRVPRSQSGSSLTSISPLSAAKQLGSIPSREAIESLGLPTGEEPPMARQANDRGSLNTLASIIPLLASMPGPAEVGEKGEPKPSRYLVEKGLPTLPWNLVENVWRLEYVDMEEFLPTPCSLQLVEQEKPSPSLQDSLVGAFNQFQALQQHKSQRRVTDVLTWTQCFTLYMAVLSKKSPGMVPSMVAHLHTVLWVQQRASSQLAWLEYDIQFRMEMAASADRVWTCGDPWQYISCLPRPSSSGDLFQVSKVEAHLPQGEGKGKRPLESEGEESGRQTKPPAKKPKKAGVCRLFNLTPGGCPYGRECIFIHRCNNCGTTDEHHHAACPFPPKPTRE